MQKYMCFDVLDVVLMYYCETVYFSMWAKFLCSVAESRFAAALLCNALWMRDAGVSRDAAYIHCYWAGNANRELTDYLNATWKSTRIASKSVPSWLLCFVSQAVRAVSRGDLLQTFPLWQMRLVVELWNSRVMLNPTNRHDALLTSEFLPVMKNMVDVALDSWLRGEDVGKMAAA